MRVDTATRRILNCLHESMLLNENGIRSDDDIEYLHDYRIAIRKTRSALTQIRSIFPKPAVDHFKSGFSWISQMTGPSRDLDVYVHKIDKYRESLSAAEQHAIEPLQEYLALQRDREHRQLLTTLASDRYRQLLADWAVFLEQADSGGKQPDNVNTPIYEFASSLIWHVYRRTLRQGRKISPDSPSEALHDLRKTCKKLRYIMEFFRSLYPNNRIKQLISNLKTLQDNLGDFQDQTVQLAALEHYKQQMMSEIQVSPETARAIDTMASTMGRRRDQARQEFAMRFSAFDSPKTRKQFRKLFSNHNRKPVGQH